MLRNKIALKRIRNVIFLGLVIIVMLGVYNATIRNSRAENTEPIDIDFVDAAGKLMTFSLEDVNATKNETTDENDVTTVTSYTIPLNNLVNGKKVSKYYNSNGEAIDAIDGMALEVPAGIVTNGKVEIRLNYDQKDVSANDQTLTIYNQSLNKSPVTISGYVPDGTNLNVTTIDKTTLSNVTLPDANLKIADAYDIDFANNYQPKSFGQTVNVAIFTELDETPVVYHISDDKTEIKNMNSINNIAKAMEYEYNRQIAVIENGGEVLAVCETEDDPQKAYCAMHELYTINPEVNAIYVNTSTSEPICRYLEEHALADRISLMGTDQFDVLNEYMKRGIMKATISQNQDEVGRIAAASAYEYLHRINTYGNADWKPERLVLIKPNLLLKANIE